MKNQTPEQSYEIIKRVYEAIGRAMPDESRTVLQGVKITIEWTDTLEVTVGEILLPVVDAQ